MIKKTIFTVLAVGFLLFAYQNCGSGNKDQFDLKYALQKTQGNSTNPTFVGPVTAVLANTPGGNTVDQFTNGSSNKIYMTISNAGSNAKICKPGTCVLTGDISTWTSMSADGWSYASNNWTKTFTLDGSSYGVGSHRVYFARPGSSNLDTADTNGFASVDFTVKP